MLGNLGQIVIANWDDFSDIIPNQAWLMSRMDDLEMSRNIIMHLQERPWQNTGGGQRETEKSH